MDTIPSFFFKPIHFREHQSQNAFTLFPGKLGHVDLSLEPSPSLRFLQIVEHIVRTSVKLTESSDARKITLASVSLEHALLVSVLGVLSILDSTEEYRHLLIRLWIIFLLPFLQSVLGCTIFTLQQIYDRVRFFYKLNNFKDEINFFFEYPRYSTWREKLLSNVSILFDISPKKVHNTYYMWIQ